MHCSDGWQDVDGIQPQPRPDLSAAIDLWRGAAEIGYAVKSIPRPRPQRTARPHEVHAGTGRLRLPITLRVGAPNECSTPSPSSASARRTCSLVRPLGIDCGMVLVTRNLERLATLTRPFLSSVQAGCHDPSEVQLFMESDPSHKHPSSRICSHLSKNSSAAASLAYRSSACLPHRRGIHPPDKISG